MAWLHFPFHAQAGACAFQSCQMWQPLNSKTHIKNNQPHYTISSWNPVRTKLPRFSSTSQRHHTLPSLERLAVCISPLAGCKDENHKCPYAEKHPTWEVWGITTPSSPPLCSWRPVGALPPPALPLPAPGAEQRCGSLNRKLMLASAPPDPAGGLEDAPHLEHWTWLPQNSSIWCHNLKISLLWFLFTAAEQSLEKQPWISCQSEPGDEEGITSRVPRHLGWKVLFSHSNKSSGCIRAMMDIISYPMPPLCW